LRIVTYNFLHGGSPKRCGHWSRLIRTFRPDLILAQECRPPEDSHSDVFAWRAASTRKWGSALYSHSLGFEPVVLPDYDGWIVGGEFLNLEWSTRPIRVFSIHGPAGQHGYIKTMQLILDRLLPFRNGADLVLGGDFNVAVGYRSDQDRIRMLRGERAILDRLAGEFDLVSCWQAANPDRRLAQTLRWMRNPSAPYHCDGIFVPRSWLPRLQFCRVIRGSRWNQLSDHNPVLAEFGRVPMQKGQRLLSAPS
jgi:endonuclease/exonuclease/phosphatase family metal-dependent hydrolase